MKKCPRCVLKHLTTAIGLLQERDYPDHQWMAIGQLVLAEWESAESDESGQIRAARLIVEQGLIDGDADVDIVESLIPHYRQKLESTRAAGS